MQDGISSQGFFLGVRPGRVIKKGRTTAFVSMKDGTSYKIFVKNNLFSPVICVITVDGREVGRFGLLEQYHFEDIKCPSSFFCVC